MKRLLFFSIGVLCLAACSSASRKAIVQAERLLDSRPDSAYVILEQIPRESLWSRNLQAKFALAYTAAQVKNYIDPQDDSLISAAYEYYRHYGSPEDRMNAAYYWGVVKQNAGETVQSSFLLNEAETLAGATGKKRVLGLARQHLSSLYAENYDPQSAYEFARKAVTAFDEAGETLSADFSRSDVARQLYILGEKTRSNAIVDSLLDCPAVTDAGLRYTLHLQKADAFFWNRNYKEAEKHYKQAEAYGYPLDPGSLANLAVVMEMTGRRAAADSCMRGISEQMYSPVDSAVYYSCRSEIDQHRGDLQSAYQAEVRAATIQNRTVSALLDRSITHSQRVYFEERYASERAQKWTVILFSALLVLLLSGVILVAFILLRKRKLRIITEMEKVEGINQDLLLLQEKQKGAGAVLTSLVQDKILVMQQLTGAYFSWTDEALLFREQMHGKTLKEDVIAEFRSALRRLRNDDHFIPAIEKTLNISNQDLIARLRESFSGASEHKMKEMDFKLLTLFFAGFTPKSISFIMDMTEESVRTRKSRYKKLFTSMGDAGLDFAARLS